MKGRYFQVTMQELPEEVEQILLGSLMGDGGIYPAGRNNESTKYLE